MYAFKCKDEAKRQEWLDKALDAYKKLDKEALFEIDVARYKYMKGIY